MTGALSPELRVKLARRFGCGRGFQFWLARQEIPPPAAEARPAPWDIIHDVLTSGQVSYLNRRQLAGGIYAALVSHGLITEDRT